MSSLKAIFKLKEGDNIDFISFNLQGGGTRFIAETGNNFSLGGFPPNKQVEMHLRTSSGFRYQKQFTTAGAGTELNLGTIDISHEQIAYITGTLFCNNALITDGQITARWDVPGSSNGMVEYANPDVNGTFTIPVSPGASVSLSISTSKGSIEKLVSTNGTAGGSTELGNINICAGPQPGENSFIINGGGYTNRKIELTPKLYPNSGSFFITAENMTTLNVVDVTDTIRFVINFAGKNTGIAVAGDKTGVFIQRKSGNVFTNYFAGLGVTGSDVQVNITRYDAAGGLIEGTFQGTFMKDDASTVTISNGKFSMLRQGDL
jgi:hypothetical protein